MASSDNVAYPPGPTLAQEGHLVASAHEWALSKGLVVRSNSEQSDQTAVTAPVTLYPSLFPRTCFEEARALQQAYNELYACLSDDDHWLGRILQE